MGQVAVERLAELLVAEIESPSPALAELLDSAAPAIADWVEHGETPALFLSRQIARAIHAKNQFVSIDPRTEGRIERACADLLLAAASAARQGATEIEPEIAEPRARLADLLRPYLSRKVVCADYDPALQLRVLGLDPDALLEPVLDLGCGYEARLVQSLRSRGISAVGVDRHVAPGAGVAADWLDYPLENEKWGTIVSHQGFSLHFIHNHLGSKEGAARYAKRMLAIIAALRPGGVFAYAPGLPFFEPMLAHAGWSITRVALAPEMWAKIPPELALRLGHDVGYAAQIRRERQSGIVGV